MNPRIWPGGERIDFLEEEPWGERSFTSRFLFQMPTTSFDWMVN
jgi:hypothetical protein